MKKINKKGFTLVELLAVVVILGVLLMIAVPAMNNVTKGTKKKSFASNVSLVLNEVNNLRLINENKGCLYYFDGDATSGNAGYVTLERGSLKGISGLIEVNNNGVVNLLYAVDKENNFYIGETPGITIIAPTTGSTEYNYSVSTDSILGNVDLKDKVETGASLNKYTTDSIDNFDKVKCDFD